MEFKNLAKALFEASKEIGNPPKNKEVRAGAKTYWYTDLVALLEVKPILRRHDILLIQSMRTTDHGINIVMSSLVHIPTGEHIEAETAIPNDLTPQQVGTCVTYYRRYQLTSLLAIVGDEDTDGDIAEQNHVVHEKPKEHYDDFKPLEPGEVVPSWWWDLLKTNKSKAMSLMPSGYKYEKNAQKKWVIVPNN